MKCAFCGEKADKQRTAMAEGGCVKLPVCEGCETYISDTFDRPLTINTLINMQKGML